MNKKRFIIMLIAALVLGLILIAIKFIITPKYFTYYQKAAAGEILNTSIAKLSDSMIDIGLNDINAITNISDFEKTEEDVWQGNGVVDEKIFYEGSRSMGLISVDRNPITITLEKKMNLTGMKQIEFMLHVSDADAFETAAIDFADSDLKNYYRYTLSNLKNGWNLIQIPKEKFILTKAKDNTFDWSMVSKVKFYALSRTNSIFLVRLDMLRSINYLDFQNQWRSLNNEQFLSIYKQGENINLLARNIGASVATLKDLENSNDFIFSVAVSPQSAGRSGLFIRGDYNNGYGYYFLIGGEKKNNWQIIKKNKDGWTPKEQITDGYLANVSFAKDKKYWLRADINNDLLQFYFSLDGQNYEKLGEITDSEFRGGGTGIATLDSSWSLFSDFQFEKK